MSNKTLPYHTIHQFGNLCYHIEIICEMGGCLGGGGEKCLGENLSGKISWWKCLGVRKVGGKFWGKMLGEIVGGGGVEECRDPENQFSLIRKT